MRKIVDSVIGVVLGLVVLFILSKVVKPVGDFLAWWFVTKEEINAPITTGQAVIIDLITHAITYVAVFILFAALDWWNSKAMHYVYVAVSEVVALGLAILLRFILDYYWIIFIIVGVLVITTIIVSIIFKVRNKKKEEAKENA